MFAVILATFIVATPGPVPALPPTAGPVPAAAPTSAAEASLAASSSTPSSAPVPASAAEGMAACPDGAALFAAQRHVEAAEAQMCRWRSGGEPRALFRAALALTHAGQLSRAAQVWGDYLDVATREPEARRAKAELQLAEVNRQLVRVELRVQIPVLAAAAGVLRIVVSHRPRAGETPLPTLAFVAPGVGRNAWVEPLRLERGAWSLRAELSTGVAIERSFAAGSGQPVELRFPEPLRPGPPAAPLVDTSWRRRARGLAIASGVLGAALVGGGAALVAVGETRRRGLLDGAPPCDPQTHCSHHLVDAFSLRAAGAGLLGAAVPVVWTGMTALVERPRRRRALWWTQFGLGTLASVGGAVVHLRETASLDAALAAAAHGGAFKPGSNDLGHTLSGGLLGFGGGLLGGAVVGLIVDRSHRYADPGRRARVTPRVSHDYAGISVSAAF